MVRGDHPLPTRTIAIALLFESGLGAAAVLIGWILGHWPLIGMPPLSRSFAPHVLAAAWGLAAALPLVAALLLIDRFPVGPLRQLRELATTVIREIFAGATMPQLAAVSLAAGLGEELLFRGLVQAGVSRLSGLTHAPWFGLLAASLLFGICHWLNTTYAVLAILAGLYFGLLLLLSGNLWTPIVAHAAYDFVALMYLVRPKLPVRCRV